MRYLKYILLIILPVIVYLFPANSAEVIFFDVGQGDAALIKMGSQAILIDGGPDNTVLKGLGRELGFFHKRIELLVLTHPHADHSTGLIEVLRRFDVGQIIVATSTEMIMGDKVLAGDSFNFKNGATLKVLHPLIGENDLSGNDLSLVLMLEYQNHKILFAGDLETGEEKKLLFNCANLSADVLKIAHHGSKYGSSQAFLNCVKPQLSVISVGKNTFGHPNSDTIARLGNVWRTDLSGSLKVRFNGKSLDFLGF